MLCPHTKFLTRSPARISSIPQRRQGFAWRGTKPVIARKGRAAPLRYRLPRGVESGGPSDWCGQRATSLLEILPIKVLTWLTATRQTYEPRIRNPEPAPRTATLSAPRNARSTFHHF